MFCTNRFFWNCFLISFRSLSMLASTSLLLNSKTKPPISFSSVAVSSSMVPNSWADCTLVSIDFFRSSLTATAVVNLTLCIPLSSLYRSIKANAISGRSLSRPFFTSRLLNKAVNSPTLPAVTALTILFHISIHRFQLTFFCCKVNQAFGISGC